MTIWRASVLTIFPEMFPGPLGMSLAGKALEIVPLVGMVVALGRTANVPTPVSEVVLALVTQLDKENQRGG